MSFVPYRTQYRRKPYAKAKPVYRTQVPRPVRQYVRTMIAKAIEDKYFDTNVAFGQIDRAGQINNLSIVPQGSAQSQRQGSSLKMKSLEIRMNSYLNCVAAATDSTHTLRAVLVKWHLTTSTAVPALGNFFQNSGTVAVTVQPREWYTKQHKDLTVLWDQTWSIQRYAGQQHVEKVIDLKNATVAFDAGAVTSGAGHLYLCLVADDVTGAHTPAIYTQWMSRLIYEDA